MSFPKRWSLWLLALLVIAAQLQESEAVKGIKLKKILKKALLFRALSGNKLTIIPLPIPMELLKQAGKLLEGDKMMMDDNKMMEGAMMMPQYSYNYPMYLPANSMANNMASSLTNSMAAGMSGNLAGNMGSKFMSSPIQMPKFKSSPLMQKKQMAPHHEMGPIMMGSDNYGYFSHFI